MQRNAPTRFVPLLLILLAAVAAVAFGVPHELSWASLGARQATLTRAADAHPAAALLVFVAAYAAIVTLSIPGGSVMSVAAGLVFGTVLGAAAATIGATCGAILLFLIVRTALRPLLARRLAPLLARIGPGLERDGFSTLLALRLIPAFPFWLVNLAPALVGMRLLPYAAATLLGVIPAAAVFAWVGAGVGGVLAAGGRPDMGVIFSPAVLGPLAGLAGLSLLPILWRRWRADA